MKLNLNDFDSFDAFLFNGKNPNWGKFYDRETDIFIPPIYRPMTLPEYQLDHYALWMVISSFCLTKKPYFTFFIEMLINGCYACHYKFYHEPYIYSCKNGCPLVLDDYAQCGTAYSDYMRESTIYGATARLKDAAEQIAKLKWREV